MTIHNIILKIQIESSFDKCKVSIINDPLILTVDEKLINSSLDELPLTIRLINFLKANGYKTLSNILNDKKLGHDYYGLLKYPNFGRKSYKEFIDFLKENNLYDNPQA